ncbi:MAG: DUF3037 domain-containing protein [Muribaculaceae bacterium]|nr:DUF3037 domain-containing protein [Muribaculaceae bacterium]
MLRYVPYVEREEFINVGIVMMCKRRRWIRTAISVAPEKLALFKAPHSHDEVVAYFERMLRVADAGTSQGVFCNMEVEERFRWIAAVKSSCVQCSRPHPGLTYDLDNAFDSLMSELVL